VGLVIPRFKHTAVLRNLLKRRLRELARTELLPASLAVDLVIRIRPDAYDATFVQLTTDIKSVLERLVHWFGSRREYVTSNESIASGTSEVQ